MKHRRINQIRCLLVVFLLLFGTIPCQAMSFTPSKQVTSMEELIRWYGGLSGNALQEGGVTKPIVSTGEVILGATPCRVDVTFLGGLRVPAGARLIIDNPNLVLMGPPSVITVEPGGVLHIRRWNMLTAQAMPQGGIVVQAGGTLIMETGVTLPDGMVTDQNQPPNKPPPEVPDKTPPPVLPPPEVPDETPPQETPDEIPPPVLPPPVTPPPVTPPVEEKLSIKGEVLKVSANRVLLAMVTLPYVDPALTETVVIERSVNAQAWNAEYIFSWDENSLGFKSNESTEFGSLFGRDRYDGSKTDFKYLARLSGGPFYLRVTLTTAEGRQTVSDGIRLTEPPAGQYTGSDDYEESGGNRGGGGQGTTDREEQKEVEVSSPNSTVTAQPKLTPKTSPVTANVAAPPALTTAPQEAVFTAQGTAEQQTALITEETVLPTLASPLKQSEEAVLVQNKPLGSSVRNWMVIAATLALCGVICIFNIKRKKS